MFNISKQYINCRCGLHLDEDQTDDPTGVLDKSGNVRKGIISISKEGGVNFTTCHDHKHITREKYNEVIPLIVAEFVEAGFTQTQEFFQKKLNVKKEYSELCKVEADSNPITAQKTTKSNKIIRNYMLHINEVENHKGISTTNQWTEEKLKKAFKSLDKPNRTVNSNMSEILKALKFNPVTIYSPIMTKSLLKELGCKTVFDPCIGWGGRMIGTTCLGEEYHYTGCEPFTKTYQGLTSMVEDLEIGGQVKLYNEPVENVLDRLKKNQYEMCLTSPPYYDLEVYSHEDTQSIKNYKTYEEWILHFIKPIVDYVCSHVTKYSCWSVKNIRTDKQYNLLDDVIKIHAENGWKLERQFSIKKSTKLKNDAEGDVTYVFSVGSGPISAQPLTPALEAIT